MNIEEAYFLDLHCLLPLRCWKKNSTTCFLMFFVCLFFLVMFYGFYHGTHKSPCFHHHLGVFQIFWYKFSIRIESSRKKSHMLVVIKNQVGCIDRCYLYVICTVDKKYLVKLPRDLHTTDFPPKR